MIDINLPSYSCISTGGVQSLAEPALTIINALPPYANCRRMTGVDLPSTHHTSCFSGVQSIAEPALAVVSLP